MTQRYSSSTVLAVRVSTVHLSLLACGVTCWLLSWAAVSAQDLVQVDPRSFGFEIPVGPVSAGNNQYVLTAGQDGNPVVAKVYVTVGEHRIVMLPDGRLVARSVNQSPLTDRRFVPTTSSELAEQLGRALPGFKTKRTHHYLFVYNTSENFALVTSRILESMFPGMKAHARAQRIDVHEPEVPLVALMFRTEDEMQAYRRMARGVVAYYHTVTNRIVMYEESKRPKVTRDLAIKQAIATIAHEGAHQILHNIGVQKRLSIWPMWLSEGLAEYYAPTSFGKRLRWKGAGQVNDLRMFELELYLKSGDSERTDGQMLEQTVTAAQLTSTGYASAWSLTHYLAKTNRSSFYKYVREVSQLEPLQVAGHTESKGIIPANMDLFKKYFGDDPALIERGLVRHLKGLPYKDPFADSPHFAATVIVPAPRRAKRDANLFHSRKLARKWIKETLKTVPDQERSAARSEVRPFPNRLMAERYVRSWLRYGQ